ncbi:hypothetical protein [Methylosinus sp. PW1]|uniref:hypothetical protein n=1 Tax=Methylosinus sp. PW1 TaxID=107636 RepID=UPI001AEBE0B9|nr:hypothetical protein [Methylosinus sp. PW1]
MPYDEASVETLCALLRPEAFADATRRMIAKVPIEKRHDELRPPWKKQKADLIRKLRNGGVPWFDALAFADAASRYGQHYGDLHGDKPILDAGNPSFWTSRKSAGYLNFGIFYFTDKLH